MKLKKIYRLGFTAPTLSPGVWNELYDSFYSISSDNNNISSDSKYCKWRLKISTGTPDQFISLVNRYLSGACSVDKEGKNYVRLYFGQGKSGCNADIVKGQVWSFLQNIKNKGKIVTDEDDLIVKNTESGATVTTKKSSVDAAREAAAAQAAGTAKSGDSSIDKTTMYIIAAMALIAVVLLILKK